MARTRFVVVTLPVAVFALAFGGSLLWFALSGNDKGARGGGSRPRTRSAAAAASPARDPLPAAKGRGWIVVSLHPSTSKPAQSFLARARIEGSEMLPVTKNLRSGKPAADAAPAVSPDGRTVAF